MHPDRPVTSDTGICHRLQQRGNHRVIRHADCDVVGTVESVAGRKFLHRRMSLLNRRPGESSLRRFYIERAILPHVGFHTAMFIKGIGFRFGSVNQRGDAIRNLIQHFSNDAIHVDRADQHNVTVGAALVHIHSHQPGRLSIPKFQFIHLHKVFRLNPTQRFPAIRFFSVARLHQLFIHLIKLQSLARQLVVLLTKRFTQGHPCGNRIFRRTIRQRLLDLPRRDRIQRLPPDQ